MMVKFDHRVHGVTLEIEATLNGFGDEVEIEELLVCVNDGPDIYDMLCQDIQNEIEEQVYKHIPDGPEYEPEEDM